MLSSNAHDDATSICTDGRNGRTVLTKNLGNPPEITPSSVTRGRTYGELVDGVLSVEARAAKTIMRTLGRDPQAARHVYELRAALGSVCTVGRCQRTHRSAGFCDMHLQRHKRALLAAIPDAVVVDRLMAGIEVEATRAECLEATRLMTARGKSAEDIARALHTTGRTITRYRCELTNRKDAA